MESQSSALEFSCPLDGSPLALVAGSLRCANGHSYDRAREGYCNLLLVHQKASLHPGDNAEMVAARRRFLEGGHYEPIARKLSEVVGALAPVSLLDAGCGEGYYLGFLKAQHPSLRVAGTDISKLAVKAAAKKYKDIAWAVASNKQLPFAQGSVEAVLSIFGFPFWESFRKTLAPGGHVVLVDPGPAHLLELRQLIYPEVKATELVSVREGLAAGFSMVSETPLDFSFRLTDRESIRDLLAMTPHGYRIGDFGRARLADTESLHVRASVVFRVLRAN